jgi:hypothetical protein
LAEKNRSEVRNNRYCLFLHIKVQTLLCRPQGNDVEIDCLWTGGKVTVKFGSPLQFEPTLPPLGESCMLAHNVGVGGGGGGGAGAGGPTCCPSSR